jgi:hypothetical protein
MISNQTEHLLRNAAIPRFTVLPTRLNSRSLSLRDTVFSITRSVDAEIFRGCRSDVDLEDVIRRHVARQPRGAEERPSMHQAYSGCAACALCLVTDSSHPSETVV